MFVPSYIGDRGPTPTVTVWRMAPAELSLSSVPRVEFDTQTLFPSKTGPYMLLKPTVTVVTVQGTVFDGWTIETEPSLAVQPWNPSRVPPLGVLPRFVAATVTAPAGCVASIW